MFGKEHQVPADKRTYITLHDGMPDHPKIGALSDKAFRTWIELLCWCSRYKTDGKVTKAWFEKVAPLKARRELLDGLVDDLGTEYAIHDYLEHQRSAAEIDELSKKRSEAGKRGLAKRYQKDNKPVASDLAIATAKPLQRGSKPLADTDTEEIDKSISTATAPPTAEFETQFQAFYTKYPRRIAPAAARRAFKAALKKTTIDVVLAAAEQYADLTNGTEQRFIPYPATWLNQERWADETRPESVAPSPWDPNFHTTPAAWNE